MDVCADKSDSSDTKKKTRSVDLHSIYIEKPRNTSGKHAGAESKVLKRKRSSAFESRQAAPLDESRRKRSRRAVSSNWKPVKSVTNRRRNYRNSSRRFSNASVAASGKLKRTHNSNVGSNSSGELNGQNNSFIASPDTNDDWNPYIKNSWSLNDGVVVPRRPRDTSRKRKLQTFEKTDEVKFGSLDGSKSIDNAERSALELKSVPESPVLDGKQNAASFREGSVTCNKEENSSDNNVPKRRKTRLKSGEKTNLRSNAAHDSGKNFRDLQADDEDNLEQNAARMLCSRFDPNCTGSGNRILFSSKSSNGHSYSHSNNGTARILHTEMPSLDSAGRMLRPRKHNGKGFARKRRHFYEVLFKDVDPLSLVRQRIRVFWPLDECWYFGLVKDYDPIKKMHHVKYDDRDEEWIDLKNERFKLLLFPSEVKSNCLTTESSGLELKRNMVLKEKRITNGNCKDRLLDSEPIISWLCRPSGLIKSSIVSILKKKRLQLRKELEPPTLSLNMVDPDAKSDVKINLSSSGPIELYNSGVESKVNIPSIPTGSGHIKPSVVYSRRRFHKTIEESFPGTSFCQFKMLSLVSIGMEAQKHNLIAASMDVGQVALKLRILPEFFHYLPYEFRGFWLLCSPFILHRELLDLWPLVRLEMLYIDDILGLQFFVFEGCLQKAVGLISSIIKTFYRHNERNKFVDQAFPVASVCFNISGFQDRRMHLIFMLHCFLHLGNSKMRCFFHKLEPNFVEMKELPLSEVKNNLVGNLLHGNLLKFCSDILKDSALLKVLSSRSFSGVIQKSLHNKSIYLNMDPALCYFEERDGIFPPCVLSFSTFPSFFLSFHLKLYLDKNMVSVKLHGTASISPKCALEVCKKITDVGCSCCSSCQVSEEMLEGFQCQVPGHWKAETKLCSVSSEDDSLSDRSLEPSAHNSVSPRNGDSLLSPTYDLHSKLWPKGFITNGFVTGLRKPRTQVSYTLPYEGGDGGKHRKHQWKARSYKNIRSDIEKKTFGGFGNFRMYQGSSTCQANILVTSGDRGWRESGAQVVLHSDDQKDWSLSVKLSGVTKYVHKVQQCLQPGSTNRYTHAMMWRGGKDWTLEFTDRHQWSLFKEMHEECYNGNIKSASFKKNIPTPGVCLIEDAFAYSAEPQFVHNSSKYFRQVGTEVDMALDPAHVVYDMDNEDEEWISNLRRSSYCNGETSEITDIMFETAMDMFEKFAYVQQCDEFSSDEMEEYMADIGPLDIIKAVHEYWRERRRKKGLPLVRQFQPPLWEWYQKQLKDWELAMRKMFSSSDFGQDKKLMIEKPPLFAFCLRPRGLNLPNKGSKQKSHKKQTISGYHCASPREHDGFIVQERKSHGSVVEKHLSIAIPSYDNSHYFHRRESSPVSSFSPRNVTKAAAMRGDGGSQRSQVPVLYRNGPKQMGSIVSPRNTQLMHTSHPKLKENGVHQVTADMCRRPGGNHWHQEDNFRHRADFDEFRLRDAPSAAQHALNMAKLMRENAQRLLQKADRALHRASVALMIADGKSYSENGFIGDG